MDLQTYIIVLLIEKGEFSKSGIGMFVWKRSLNIHVFHVITWDDNISSSADPYWVNPQNHAHSLDLFFYVCCYWSILVKCLRLR